MKEEIVELFTKRVLDFSLLNWLEVIAIFIFLSFIYAIFKTIIESR